MAAVVFIVETDMVSFESFEGMKVERKKRRVAEASIAGSDEVCV